jgi:hypothetical protein
MKYSRATWLGRRIFASFCLALVSLSAGIAASDPYVQGIVADAEGRGLPGLQIRLFDLMAERFDQDHLLAQGVTGEEGRFELVAPRAGRMLLKIVGEHGKGRVAVTAEPGGDAVFLRYPVRTEIVLLHDNDMHFNFNYLEAFRARLSAFRQAYPNVFLLNAGDIFIRYRGRWPQPGDEGYLRSCRFMIETMNDLGYDALTVGNHELYYIGDVTRQVLELARFPLLSANVEITTERLPQPQPYMVLETEERYRLAVLGLSVVNDQEGVEALDPIAVARQYVGLADEHDVLVGLTHLGLRTDRRLAEAVPAFEVIIGGHSHDLLEEAERVGQVLVAQAGGSPGGHPVDSTLPKYLGVVRILLENGRVVEKSGYVETIGEN